MSSEKQMKTTIIEDMISRLDALIATIGQAVVLSGLNDKEREAYELLKDARLKLVEDLEQRGAPGWKL